MSSGSNVLTVASYTFTSADVGKIAVCLGAGASGALLHGYIASVSSGNAVLTSDQGGTTPINASTTVSGKQAAWGSDDTAALNAAFTAAAQPGAAAWVVIPEGWYRYSQLVVQSGIKVTGAGWGNTYGVAFGLQHGQAGGTLLQQLEGAEQHGVIFNYQYYQSAGSFYFIGPVTISDLVVKGPYTGTPGDGIYVGVNASGIQPGTPQDSFMFDNIQVIGFPGNGITFPKGGLPLKLPNCRSFYNGGYGLSFNGQGGTQSIGIDDFSGDGNALGLMFFTGITGATGDGSVEIQNLKSEMAPLSTLGSNSIERTYSGEQVNAIIIDNCSNTFTIDGVTHISSDSTTGPSAAILLQNGSTADIDYTAVGVRVASGQSATNAFVLTDTTVDNTISVPRIRRSGFYHNGLASRYAPREDFFAATASSTFSTMSRYLAQTTLGFTTGAEYGALVPAKLAANYTQVRFQTGTVTGITEFHVVLWDANGNLLLSTSDLSGSLVANNGAVSLSLGTTWAIAGNTNYFLGIAVVGTTLQLRGLSMAGSAVGPVTQRQQTGYSGGTPASLTAFGTNTPWIELVP